jgi:hypothetical protein
MTMKNWLLASGVAVVLTVSGVASAANPTLLNKFNDWVASTYSDNGKTLCYATSEPRKQSGNFKSRGKAYIAVTHVSDSNVRDQVSYIAGYELKPDSPIKVAVGKQTYTLDLVQKDRAWTKDPEMDKALVAAMRKGNALVIKGISSRGTEITDTYSLSGFSKAYQAIGTACKVK